MIARVADAAAAMGGAWSGDPDRRFAGATLDSRKVAAGELFFALAGAATDGHRFVADALARGAAAAVVERPVDAPAEALVVVPDSYAALHALTRAVRTAVPRRGLVGITGSTGKTTTKELTAAVLARRFAVARSPGNLNNLYGFPLALLGIDAATEWMVAELGMSTPGELHDISLLARPDIAVFTNVRPVHLEFFGTVAAIAEAKAELLAGLAPGGRIVANLDDPQVERIARRHGAAVTWYGHGEEATVRAHDVRPAQGRVGTAFTLEIAGEQAAVELPLHGLYNVDNALAAAAVGHLLGLDVATIAEGLAATTGAAMRGVVHAVRGATVVDDAYNSNPYALERALESAAALPGQRHWAVIGDMLELGPEAPRFHRESGAGAARRGFSPIAAVGTLAAELAAGARDAGGEARTFADAAAAAPWAAEELAAGDVVLVKGSRGVRLEKVVAALLAGVDSAAGGGG